MSTIDQGRSGSNRKHAIARLLRRGEILANIISSKYPRSLVIENFGIPIDIAIDIQNAEVSREAYLRAATFLTQLNRAMEVFSK